MRAEYIRPRSKRVNNYLVMIGALNSRYFGFYFWNYLLINHEHYWSKVQFVGTKNISISESFLKLNYFFTFLFDLCWVLVVWSFDKKLISLLPYNIVKIFNVICQARQDLFLKRTFYNMHTLIVSTVMSVQVMISVRSLYCKWQCVLASGIICVNIYYVLW